MFGGKLDFEKNLRASQITRCRGYEAKFNNEVFLLVMIMKVKFGSKPLLQRGEHAVNGLALLSIYEAARQAESQLSQWVNFILYSLSVFTN